MITALEQLVENHIAREHVPAAETCEATTKISSFNVHAYPSVYGTTCVVVGDQSLPIKG